MTATVVDSGPPPNPRKAAEGFRLRVLAIDEAAAEVVRRIFTEYLDGYGDRAIATELNRDGIPCPAARRRDQNRHRLADGWQSSVVRAILENPRYTGYAIFGRWSKHEALLDPEDVSAGHVVRFRRSRPDGVIRSRQPAHPAIVSVAEFTEAQLLRRSRGAGGLQARAKLERGPKPTKRAYPLRGRVRCALCSRRLEGTPRQDRTYYRCAARTITPGSPVLADHPKNVYLPEHAVLPPMNAWIGRLFDPDHREHMIDQLLAAASGAGENARQQQAKRKLADAETRLRRLQGAIEAGADPAALVEAVNRAHEGRLAARADLDQLMPATRALGRAEVAAIVDELGNIGAALDQPDPAELEQLYAALGLEMVYDPRPRVVDVSLRPVGRGSTRVRGGT